MEQNEYAAAIREQSEIMRELNREIKALRAEMRSARQSSRKNIWKAAGAASKAER